MLFHYCMSIHVYLGPDLHMTGGESCYDATHSSRFHNNGNSIKEDSSRSHTEHGKYIPYKETQVDSILNIVNDTQQRGLK